MKRGGGCWISVRDEQRMFVQKYLNCTLIIKGVLSYSVIDMYCIINVINLCSILNRPVYLGLLRTGLEGAVFLK